MAVYGVLVLFYIVGNYVDVEILIVGCDLRFKFQNWNWVWSVVDQACVIYNS